MIEAMSRVARVLAILIAVVGAVDAVRGEHWDQVAMLSVIAFLLITELGLQRLRAATVEIRADHLDWLREESSRTDDTVGLVAGRAIAAYRATRAAPSGRAAEP